MGKVILIIALLGITGCGVEEALTKVLSETIDGTIKEVKEPVKEFNTTVKAPVKTTVNTQTAPARPTLKPVEAKVTRPNTSAIVAGKAITGIVQELRPTGDSFFFNINNVVHNTAKGDYKTVSGKYTLVKLAGVKRVSVGVSTKPNCSIRVIASSWGVAQTNKQLDRGLRSYLAATGVGNFVAADPFSFSFKSSTSDTYLYLAIDNDNTNSYFNKTSCKVGLALIKEK